MGSFRFRHLALVLPLALGLAACASFDVFGESDAFEEQQKKFSQLVRWGQMDAASRFVIADQRKDFLALGPELSNMQFSDYEILFVDLSDDFQEATVDVRFEAFNRASLVQRNVSMTQEWSRDETGEWVVTLDMERLRTALLLGPR